MVSWQGTTTHTPQQINQRKKIYWDIALKQVHQVSVCNSWVASRCKQAETSTLFPFNKTHRWLLSMLRDTIFTSTGVVSGTSLRIMMQRLWLGRTFSPASSTCTTGEAVKTKTCKRRRFVTLMEVLKLYKNSSMNYKRPQHLRCRQAKKGKLPQTVSRNMKTVPATPQKSSKNYTNWPLWCCGTIQTLLLHIFPPFFLVKRG